MEILGITIGLAEVVIVIGAIAVGGGFGLYKLPFSKKFLVVVGLLICVGGAFYGGYLGPGGLPDRDTDDGDDILGEPLTEGLNVEAWLKDAETKTGISSKTVGLYEEDTTLLDIQSNKVTPIDTATSDSNGKVIFYGLKVGDYVIAFDDDEDAFDGTHYTAASKTITVRSVNILESDETVSASPDPNLYVKKLGDAFYTITGTSGSNSTSGGVDEDATITESGSGGTTVHVTISCATDQAWLTDSAYHRRIFITDVFTDNGGANTAVTLADCRTNSSSGEDILKDSSASYYIDVTTSVMKNTAKNQNQTFTFSIWVPDLGTVNTTADTYALTFKLTLLRPDSTNRTLLTDAGHKVTITQA